MNSELKQKINQLMQKEFEKIITIYQKERILGIFSAGNLNYGFYEETELPQFICIYLPSFDDLCWSDPMEERFSSMTKIIDIRNMYYAEESPGLTALELLYSQFYIINESYKFLYNKFFLENREEISRVNPFCRVSGAFTKAKEALKQGNEFEYYRLYLSTYYYLNDKPCNECYMLSNTSDIELLWNLKHRIYDLTIKDRQAINDFFNESINKLKKPHNPVLAAVIKKGVVELIKQAVDSGINEETIKDNFYSALTNREKECLDIVLSNLNNKCEGIISAKNIEDTTDISKTTIRNLFKKMEKYNVSTITSRGRKGTEIKLKLEL